MNNKDFEKRLKNYNFREPDEKFSKNLLGAMKREARPAERSESDKIVLGRVAYANICLIAVFVGLVIFRFFSGGTNEKQSSGLKVAEITNPMTGEKYGRYVYLKPERFSVSRLEINEFYREAGL